MTHCLSTTMINCLMWFREIIPVALTIIETHKCKTWANCKVSLLVNYAVEHTIRSTDKQLIILLQNCWRRRLSGLRHVAFHKCELWFYRRCSLLVLKYMFRESEGNFSQYSWPITCCCSQYLLQYHSYWSQAFFPTVGCCEFWSLHVQDWRRFIFKQYQP
jgi:hypothetical protein